MSRQYMKERDVYKRVCFFLFQKLEFMAALNLVPPAVLEGKPLLSYQQHMYCSRGM